VKGVVGVTLIQFKRTASPLVGLLLLAPGAQLLGRRAPVEQRVGIAQFEPFSGGASA
jgi:hypothetical protein